MATKNYTSSFSPAQVVFHVSLQYGIRKGVVDKIQVVDNSNAVITYFIIFGTDTKATPVTSDVWAALGNASEGSMGGGALEAYQTMLLAV